MNQQIRAREVRLIDEDGGQLGVVPIRDALRIAYDKGLDLVEVASQATPTVCRIMDYGRFKYEQAKRDREARKRQHVIDVKEVKLRINIDDHDFEVKARNALRFLRDGDKVKATIMFRGREVTHASLGRIVLDRLAEFVADYGTVEMVPKVEGRNMVMVFGPKVSKDSHDGKDTGEVGEGVTDAAAPTQGAEGVGSAAGSAEVKPAAAAAGKNGK